MEEKKIKEIKSNMIEEALKKYKKIYPASVNRTIDECFTMEDGNIFLWFNVGPDLTTRLMKREVPS